MSRKRQNTSSPEASPSPPPKPRPQASYYDDGTDDIDPQSSKERPQVSATAGQTGAFPGLGDAPEDEPFYGPAYDGIDYIKMVRSEARAVPDILVAAREEHSKDDEDLEAKEALNGGYYDDGTYISQPQIGPSEEIQLLAAQLRYYDSLLAQFRLLHATLRCQPPLEAVQELDKARPISFPAGAKKARQRWRKHIMETDPSMVQIACLDTESAIQLVRMLRDLLMVSSSSTTMSSRIGAWIWAALGRCPELGLMGSEEVAELRALGKRALAVLTADTVEGDSEADDDEPGERIEDAIGDKNSAAIQQPTGTEGSGAPLRMVLDMILTIVGEAYGQRDLLEQREAWKQDKT